MMNRRYVADSFEFDGEAVTYYRLEFDRVEPCQDNPYVEGGRCMPDARDVPPSRPTPVRRHSGPRCLTKCQFVRAFQAEAVARGHCFSVAVLDRAVTVSERVYLVRRAFEGRGLKLPRRIRKLLADYDARDLAFAYDTGWMGRLMYLYRSHCDRRWSFGWDVASQIMADPGLISALSIEAALACKPI